MQMKIMDNGSARRKKTTSVSSEVNKLPIEVEVSTNLSIWWIVCIYFQKVAINYLNIFSNKFRNVVVISNVL
jgi:hypothetical protein